MNTTIYHWSSSQSTDDRKRIQEPETFSVIYQYLLDRQGIVLMAQYVYAVRIDHEKYKQAGYINDQDGRGTQEHQYDHQNTHDTHYDFPPAKFIEIPRVEIPESG